MEQPKPAKLADVLNYQPDQYFNNDEISLIRNVFSDKRVLKVLRKVMIPTISDPDLPIESFGDDFFLAGRNYDQIPQDEVKTLVVARQEAIKFIAGGLVKLQVIANVKEPTPQEVENARRKNSVK